MVKKICIVGPECTGKSSLSSQLATHYNTLFALEYGRIFLENNDKKISNNDLIYIGKQQLNIEMELLNNPNIFNKQFVFFDTGMWTMKVWFEWVFDACPTFILDAINAINYDAYLLCYPNLPWESDGIRECFDFNERVKIYQCYLDIVINTNKPFVLINSSYNRYNQALQFLNHYF
ncbi:MAG: ATP-binding protein [Alphaproteobacteria bacterium]|nr:ATP-binding protein [Alphaproteobacteria bacterium]